MVYPADTQSFSSITNDLRNKDPNIQMLPAVVKAAHPLEAFCLAVFTDTSVQNGLSFCMADLQCIYLISTQDNKKVQRKMLFWLTVSQNWRGNWDWRKKKYWNIVTTYLALQTDETLVSPHRTAYPWLSLTQPPHSTASRSWPLHSRPLFSTS